MVHPEMTMTLFERTYTDPEKARQAIASLLEENRRLQLNLRDMYINFRVIESNYLRLKSEIHNGKWVKVVE